MSTDTLRLLSYVFYILSAACFIIGLILFFTLNIKNVINELSGRAQKKAVERIRNDNNALDRKSSTAKLDVSGISETDDLLKTTLLQDNQTQELETVILYETAETTRNEYIKTDQLLQYEAQTDEQIIMDIDIVITQGYEI